ncbi:hypothetical protein JDV09_01705 [Mycobacterium sp. Y57]|uniref:hypothetical protein n=1 Tax=Mycolicibacterium xanthum TaxID=2796469 RepID=UPI001C862762|nr:hypothetical protein [Mycolicibacterium xanthum]MBX7430832.1 hypothetical protein [Mycolicibacterium xanthum]
MPSRRFSPVRGALTGAARLPHYRLVVVADGVGDVIGPAGGFLCDRARAGWDVTVLLTGACDTRPLRILGVDAGRLSADVGSVIDGLSAGEALALGADQLAVDGLVRDRLQRTARRGLNEITVWGAPAAAELGRGLQPVVHTLSAAARAFKSHAQAAAGIAGSPGEGSEPLYRLRADGFRRLYPV